MINPYCLRESARKEVIVANGSKTSVECVGDVKQPVFLNGHKDLVPRMCANLLSIRRTVLQGHEAVFNLSGCKIYNQKREIIASGSLVNNMFKLDIDFGNEFETK